MYQDRRDKPGESAVEARRQVGELLDVAPGVRVFRRGGARPQTALIVAYIDAYRDRFGVDPICRVLSEHDMAIAPSIYLSKGGDLRYVDAVRD
jgi:hypothetical protein